VPSVSAAAIRTPSFQEGDLSGTIQSPPITNSARPRLFVQPSFVARCVLVARGEITKFGVKDIAYRVAMAGDPRQDVVVTAGPTGGVNWLNSTRNFSVHLREPAACASHRKSGYARGRLRSAFKGPVRGMDDGMNSFVDDNPCRACGKEQGGNGENKNGAYGAYGAFENWVYGVTFQAIA
jgi:hypothetical protein